MKIKKIVAAIAAAAMAVSMAAVNAFAATVTLDSEYGGAWAASSTIPKADLEAIGGDVKVTLTVETYDPIGNAEQFLIAPMDYDNGWTRIASLTDGNVHCTQASMNIVAKNDGFICVPNGTTTIEFVVDSEAISGMGDSGLSFQLCNVIVKSADLEAGTPGASFTFVTDDEGSAYSRGEFDPFAGGAAADEAPAADTAPTTSATTGNVPAAVMVSVMAVAGAAAVAAKKRK